MATQTVEDMLKHVGKSLPRVDAIEKVTGKAVYTYDMVLPNMLHAKIKRSTCPHGRIIRIDVEKARAMPGVKAVITAEDIPPNLFGSAVMDQPVLARDVVRYVGEPIAAVAAESEDLAQEAVDEIRVECQELPVLFDAEEALKPDPSVIIHPDFNEYKKMTDVQPKMDLPRPNVNYYFKARNGDVDKAFQNADLVIENRYSNAMMAHVALENMACMADVEADGTVVVWTSTQSPFRYRSALIAALNLPASKVRVIAPPAGGGFGAKLIIYNEAITAYLAIRTGKPVKSRMTREENFGATTVRHPFTIYLKDGFMKDGTLLARQMKVILDGGAYSGADGVYVTRNCVFGAAYCYRIPNFRFEAYRVYTNKPIGGALRGFGSVQMEWAIESQMDIAADKLGMDPVEIRRKNLLNDGELNALNERVHRSGKKEVLDKVANAIEWATKPTDEGLWRIGKGVAIGSKYSYAPAISSAEVKMYEDESVEVRIGVNDFGQGLYTVIAQIAAEQLGIPVENVKVIQPDTRFVPYDDGGFSSRCTFNTGNAVILAIQDLKKQIIEIASKKIEARSSDLDVEGGKIIVRDDPSRWIRIGDLFSGTRHGRFLTEGGELLGKATWIKKVDPLDPETGLASGGMASAFFTPAALGVEVAVNIETGQIKLRKIAWAVDAGKAINPLLVLGQVEGAIAMGVSGALHEEMLIENGRVVNSDFMDYNISRARDLPYLSQMSGTIVEVPQEDGPFGARGVGEAPVVLPAPAIGNAVYRAVGVRIYDMPVTAEKVFMALTSRKNRTG